ncbi:unnamed protein product [Rotaria sp. Silwood1]|nr:unnamed protein product [Rotaria sp. Silwood1]CAF4978400.1 unnamed protein product [Rotaria sp. Silwood1]
MASTRRQQNLCTICGAMAGVFLCRGCNNNFCLIHTTEHRNFLQKSMNDIDHNCEILKDNIQGQKDEEYYRLMMGQIEQWEQQSIEKIRRVADDNRQQMSIITRNRTGGLKEKIEELQRQLAIARQDGGFYENDLQEWTRRLDELQNIITQQRSYKIDLVNDSNPFISKIAVNDESNVSFQMNISLNNYDEDGIQYKPEDYSNKYNQYDSNKHNQDSYSSGKHTLRFKIHQSDPNNSVIFGVISKQKSINSFVSENSTFYGWTNNDLVCLGGDFEPNYHGYRSDFQTGDIYQLTIDCEQKKIRLKNERTNTSHELKVDTMRCPFPWQPNVRIINNY